MTRAGRPRKTPVTLAGHKMADKGPTGPRGRPRKEGERYPSGKIRPKIETPPALIKRVVRKALEGAEDSILGTPVGWLRLHRRVSDIHVSAAVEYGKCRGKADRVFGLPRRSAVSPSYEIGYGARTALADVPDLDGASERYDELRRKLRDHEKGRFGARLVNILDRVVVDGLMPAEWEMQLLAMGLDVCAQFFRIQGANARKTA